MERTINTANIIVTEDTTLKELLDLLGTVEREKDTPTPKALREKKKEDGTVEKIRPVAEAMEGDCLVYANGYAVYSNMSGTTVLWLPDCRSFTYQFDELNPKEKEYLPQRYTVDEETIVNQPWFMAVMLRGDHQVERNAMDRKGNRKGKDQNISLEGITEKEEKAEEWIPGYRFENPERAYLRKERLEEQLGKLTDRQREVFVLYHRYGYAQQEIADMLGISRNSVDTHLRRADGKIRISKFAENFF